MTAQTRPPVPRELEGIVMRFLADLVVSEAELRYIAWAYEALVDTDTLALDPDAQALLQARVVDTPAPPTREAVAANLESLGYPAAADELLAAPEKDFVKVRTSASPVCWLGWDESSAQRWLFPDPPAAVEGRVWVLCYEHHRYDAVLETHVDLARWLSRKSAPGDRACRALPVLVRRSWVRIRVKNAQCAAVLGMAEDLRLFRNAEGARLDLRDYLDRELTFEGFERNTRFAVIEELAPHVHWHEPITEMLAIVDVAPGLWEYQGTPGVPEAVVSCNYTPSGQLTGWALSFLGVSHPAEVHLAAELLPESVEKLDSEWRLCIAAMSLAAHERWENAGRSNDAKAQRDSTAFTRCRAAAQRHLAARQRIFETRNSQS